MSAERKSETILWKKTAKNSAARNASSITKMKKSLTKKKRSASSADLT